MPAKAVLSHLYFSLHVRILSRQLPAPCLLPHYCSPPAAAAVPLSASPPALYPAQHPLLPSQPSPNCFLDRSGTRLQKESLKKFGRGEVGAAGAGKGSKQGRGH